MSFLVLAALLLGGPAAAQDPALTVTAGFPANEWVRSDHPISVTVSRRPGLEEGRLAFVLGQTDVTPLFRTSGDAAVYDAATQRLPPGETELVVYLVAPAGTWTEVSRVPLKVLTPSGLRKARSAPSVSLGLKAQVAEGHTPDTNTPPRETFEDVSLQAALDTEHTRGDVTLTTSAAVVGTSHREEALRFAERGAEAPLVDLSSWRTTVQKGAWMLRLGELTWGRQRHLADQFSTRGTVLQGKIGPRVDLTLGAMNGTRIVGWDNVVGVSRPDHRIGAATLGLELLPRAGAIRLELSGLDGSVLPEAGASQGVLNDAAESRGAGARVDANLAGGRFRVLGAYTRSEFLNPADPTLQQGLDTVGVVPVTRDARFATVALDLLQNRRVTDARSATLTMRYDHERVEPLFGSVASSSTRADVDTDTFAATAALGEVNVQATHTRQEDNLGEIASILKTLTRRDAVAANLPLSSLRRGATPTAWLPVLSYTFDRTHQFGAGLPVDSDFSAGHVPDQWSRSHTGAATWQGAKWSLAYRLSRSDQDNRQPGRELADFAGRAHALAFSLALERRLTLGLETAFETARNVETGREDELQRYGANLDWQPWRRLNVAGSVSFTDSHDVADTALSRATEADLQASWLVLFRGARRGPQARLFVRAATQRARAEDLTLALDDERTAWQLSTGFNFVPFAAVNR